MNNIIAFARRFVAAALSVATLTVAALTVAATAPAMAAGTKVGPTAPPVACLYAGKYVLHTWQDAGGQLRLAAWEWLPPDPAKGFVGSYARLREIFPLGKSEIATFRVAKQLQNGGAYVCATEKSPPLMLPW